MEKEQELYDKFVDVLYEKLKTEPTSKDLEVILKFLQANNIQATTRHRGLSALAEKATALPFEDEDELPERVLMRIK